MVANSTDVEVLMFDKSEIVFFPEDVQREIVMGLRKSLNIERPYQPEDMEQVKKTYRLWDLEKQKILLQALKGNIPGTVQIYPSSFVDKEKVNLVELSKE